LAIIPDDGGTEADGPVVIPPASDGPVVIPPASDALVSPAVDASPDQPVPPDGATPGSSSTKIIDWQGGVVDLGDAELIVPKEAFAQPTTVTLTLVSDDGKLEGYPGPIGPIFSASKADAQPTDAQPRPVPLQHPASIKLSFRPADPSIPEDRVALAYLEPLARLWIIVSGSSYDATAGVVTGSVFEFLGTRLFAPVESCLLGGQICPGLQTCKAAACQ
jgi:hypothetical protein